MRWPTLALFCAVALLGGGCGAAHSGDQAGAKGIVRFALSADPTTLDPLFAHADAAVVEQQLAHLSFEPFFDLDQHGKPVPELLSRIPTVANGGVSPDGRTIVYHLRVGLRWSDGEPVTSRDVLFTLHAIMDPANPVGSRDGYDLIDRAEALGPRTVLFHLRRAWAPAVATFFTYGTAPQYVLPEHVLAAQRPLARAAFGAAPTVVDGPFILDSWKRGDRLVYRANPRYWRGRPAVDRLDIRIVPDPGTNLTLLRAGDFDFNLIAPAQMAALRGAPGIALARVPTALIAGIALNVATPALSDARVRRALAESIDRNAISEKITLGQYPVADSDRPRFSWAYDPAVREPRYDPAAADAGFDAAGWRFGPDGVRTKEGRRLALVYVQFPETTTGVRVATFVQEELRRRGVDVTIKSISNAQLFLPAAEGGMLALGRFDLAYVPWQMGADPDDRFLLGCTRATQNYMRYCNAAVDSAEDRAVAEPQQDVRRTLYGGIDRLVAREVPIVYLFNPQYVYAYRSRLHGFAPNAFSPTWNAYAWSVGDR
jgi:peptide/nickel transport system substrate-binding protein